VNKVVIDTNILVSALLSNGPPAVIMDFIADGILIPFYNDFIIAEYWEVLQRSKFCFHSSRVNRLINSIIKAGLIFEADKPSAMPLPDEDDRIFYDTAKASSSFLITGNKKHFPKETFILSPADFLKQY